MATQDTTVYARNELIPFQAPELARESHGQFAASLDLAAGTVIAPNGSNKYVAHDPDAGDSATNEVQTITFSGTRASGNYKISVTARGVTRQTGNIAWNANAATIQAALEGLSNVRDGEITVADTSGTVLTLTFGGELGATNVDPVAVEIVDLATSAPAAITAVVATTTAGAAAGASSKAIGITRYPVVTDASGNVTNFNESGALEDSAPYYTSGIFRTTDIANLTLDALNDLGGRVIAGTLADGVIQF